MKKEFSKQFLMLLCLASLGLLAGCSSDVPGNGPEPNPKPETQVDTATLVKSGNLTFAISEKPFDADLDTDTRAYEPPMVTDTVELADGVEAEITIERDKPASGTRGPTPEIKHLRDGHYHIFAYQGGVRKGWLHFIVQGGQLNAWGKMMLEPGTYDLCCFNTKVTYPTDFSWFGMNIGNAGQELFGVAKNVYIGGLDYKIPISIGHHSARIRTKIFAMMDIPTDVRTKLYSKPNTAPANIVYRPATGNFETSGTTTINTVNTTAYTAAADINVPGVGTMKTMLANDYQYVMAGTKPSDLIMHITNGSKLYGKEMYKYNHVAISSSTQQFLSNRSYTISVKLLPNFKYVFEDGYRRYLRNRGNHIPVALAFSDHLGIALSDAHPIGYPNDLCPSTYIPIRTGPQWKLLSWSATVKTRVHELGYTFFSPRNNLPGFPFTSWEEAFNDNSSGRAWTWDPNCTSDINFDHGGSVSYLSMIQRVKGNAQQYPTYLDIIFPAFYWAAQYPLVKRQEAQAAGLTDLAGLSQELWFLPSASEWNQFLKAIGFSGSFSPVTPATRKTHGVANYNAGMIDYALRKAGGTPFWDNTGLGYNYWTSSEYEIHPNSLDGYAAFTIGPNSTGQVFVFAQPKQMDDTSFAPRLRVRSFVAF